METYADYRKLGYEEGLTFELDKARKHKEKEMLNARIALINMKRKGFNIDTEQARWLKQKAGLAT